jgi:hypothetical protein
MEGEDEKADRLYNSILKAPLHKNSIKLIKGCLQHWIFHIGAWDSGY